MASETWRSMPQDLQNLRVRVSAFINRNSLEKLSLTKVANMIGNHCKTRGGGDTVESLVALVQPHIHRFCQEYVKGNLRHIQMVLNFDDLFLKNQDPFKDLPPVLLRALQKVLRDKDLLTSSVLPSLVSGNTERLEVYLNHDSCWSQRDVNDLLDRIQEMGTNISELVIDSYVPNLAADANVPILDAPKVQPLLLSLTKLTVLNLNCEKVDDSFLACVGSNCPELRNLTFPDCEAEITKKGIGFLCVDDGTHGKCKKLSYLNFNENTCGITALVLAFENLPELMYVIDYYLYVAVVRYAKKHKNSKLKLKQLTIQTELSGYELVDTLPIVVSTVPDIKSLNISLDGIESVDELLNLQHISEIDLTHSDLSPTNIILLANNYTNSLTKLVIQFYDEEIDLTIIGFHCKNLVELIWETSCPEHLKYKLQPFVHFSKLKEFQSATLKNEDYIIPDNPLKCILVSPSLKVLYLRHIPFSDDVVNWLTEEARTRTEIFSNVEGLILLCNISIVNVKRLFCLAPKLNRINVNDNIKESIREFLVEHNFTHCKVIP